jgi:phosphoglycolate/pyridoxal phosphate phosphatase family enzyme
MNSLGQPDERGLRQSEPSMPALADLFDGWLIDLDGVVYVGDDPLPGAPEALRAIRGRGAGVLFVTNDPRSSREEYARRLAGLGVPTEPDDVVTSGSATADYLRREGLSGHAVFVMGSSALKAEMVRVGCRVVEGRDGLDAEVVVVGGHAGFDYAELAVGSIAARRGARLVATNRDATFPTPDGPAPAVGAIVAAVETASGRRAIAVGKPEPLMFELARERLPDRERVVVVGDRLDVDVLGGHRAGLATILVRDPDRPDDDHGERQVDPDYEVPVLAAVLDVPP